MNQRQDKVLGLVLGENEQVRASGLSVRYSTAITFLGRRTIGSLR